MQDLNLSRIFAGCDKVINMEQYSKLSPRSVPIENTSVLQISLKVDGKKKFNDEIMAHNSEELEAFELDSLRMVGTLQSESELWAIVVDSTGTVHRVQVGNYMGRNFGKVLEILEDRVELREIVKDADGNWEERNASLALAEQP